MTFIYMFSNKAQLQKRTPENGIDRENFLSLLVDEYLNSDSLEARCQVLANLANFAYDPLNYGFIRDTGVLDIYLYVLKNETSIRLLHFASAGICNICNDPLNAEYILKHLTLKPIVSLLQYEDTEIITNALTALIYLYNDDTKHEIIEPNVVQQINDLNKSEDKRISNLATVFLQDILKVNS